MLWEHSLSKQLRQTFINNFSFIPLEMAGVAGEIFFQLGLIVIVTAIAALVLRFFRQPQILAYVLVGILITPVLKIVTNTSIIESMSMIGIAFLLFLVGLEMDLKSLKNVALVSTLGGLIQILLLFSIGFFVAIALGFLNLEAAYVGLFLAFSSTMVVMKLISDKRELNTLHGRIIVGFLLIEDILAIFALSFLTSVNGFSSLLFVFSIVKFLSLFAVAYLASKYIFPLIFQFAARHQELLLILSLAVCFLFSFAFQYWGFSLAIGAFIAGISLGNLQYNLDIVSRVKSLRDFFALLFFVSLGMGLSVGVIQKYWVHLAVLLLVVLIIKPFLTMLICSVFKFTKKPAFLTAISLAQIGEFALIIAAQGLVLGHISQDLFSLSVLLALISITITSYTIKYDYWLYKLLEKPLRLFDVFNTQGMGYLPSRVKPTIVLCGHNRIGYSILRDLRPVKEKVLIVDFNPEVIAHLMKEGYNCLYGDVTDDEIVERMNLERVSLMISTVPDVHDNILLISKLKAVNKTARIMVTGSTIEEALELYNKGADYVIMPHFLGGEHVSGLVTQLRNRKLKLHEEREKHLHHLRERRMIGHEHPTHG